MIVSPRRTIAMVFSGGLGLAAYHAGVYEAFLARGHALHWVTGSSAGAVTAALIEGNEEAQRIERLREYWRCSPIHAGGHTHFTGWLGAMTARLFGSAGHFVPRLPSLNPLRFHSLYDLAPLRATLSRLIDFDRLNSGDIRVAIVATDVETGEPVLFDSAHDRIGMDHLLASCGFLPEFAPVEIQNRLLVDGGLSWNAPFDPILQECDGDLLVYIVDLYARDGRRPRTLEAALERKSDLLFGNQTMLRLRYMLETRRLRRTLRGNQPVATEKIVLLSYRANSGEPGPEKSFDFSDSALAERWQAGHLDMEAAHRPAAQENDEEPIIIVRRGSYNKA
jgi:NTE family protein